MMFDELKSQFEEWAKSNLEQLSKELNDRYGIPEPDGEFVLFRTFDISEPLISKGAISLEENSWKIEAYDSVKSTFNSDVWDRDEQPLRNTKLFTFSEPDRENCVIACRAWLKTSGMNKSARLRLGLDREADFFGMSGGKMSRHYETSIFNSQWQEYEVRHCFRKDKYPTTFWLNLDIYQPGVVWIKNIRLFKASFKSIN